MTITVLPNKYIPIHQSILGVAALLMERVRENDTVSSLWDRVQANSSIRTFDRYTEALTLLYAGGLISLEEGILQTKNKKRVVKK